ncbi:MAG: pyruvate, phosphate dikinase, partial [Dehalococcoidia bacterium]
MADKYVFSFAEGAGPGRRLLGGKGAGLCEMTRIGLPVPPGFVVTTEACRRFLDDGRLPPGLVDEIHEHISLLEKGTGRLFGGGEKPLLVAVRSGAAVSMPGMMDTILNLGLNRTTVRALYRETGDARFAFDAQRRFLGVFATVALGLPVDEINERTRSLLDRHGVEAIEQLDAPRLEELVSEYRGAVEASTGWSFPEDPYVQLELAVRAVFKSWLGRRALDYRHRFGIGPEVADGTAVNVCAMVFGNLGDTSGTGVGFTRDPATGQRGLYGEFLANAQGDDLVAGTRTPVPIPELESGMPEVHAELLELAQTLERHFHEVQDFEFTVERGRLFCLQTRNAKMNATAVVRTSVELAREGVIDRARAISRPAPDSLDQILVPQIAGDGHPSPLATGLAAAPGAVSGRIALDAASAVARAGTGEDVILVREETRPEDVHGFFAARGILTARGGRTSHAAVVARGMGKPCVCGCAALDLDSRPGEVTIAGAVFAEGDIVTIDGATGHVYAGAVPTEAGGP